MSVLDPSVIVTDGSAVQPVVLAYRHAKAYTVLPGAAVTTEAAGRPKLLKGSHTVLVV